MQLPFHQIPDYPESYHASNVLARMIDGLGYRLFWATDDLRSEDISYKPHGENTKSVDETMDHILSLSSTINNAVQNLPNIRPMVESELSFEEKRKNALVYLKNASDFLKSSDHDIGEMNVIFQRGENKSSFPIWNLINGQIADALYHTGQLVSYRRSSGNPINPMVNVFTGKNRSAK